MSNPPTDMPSGISSSVLPPQRRRLLAPWTAVPLLAVVAAEIYWGLPAARLNATSSVAGYLAGRVLGALLLCFVFAWLGYFIFRRSTIAASITFTLVAALCCHTVMRRAQTHYEFPTAGISVDSPPGWAPVRSLPSEILIGWIAPGSSQLPNQMKGQVFIRVSAANPGLDGSHSADALAAANNGKIMADSIDGEPAWRIVAGPNTPVQGLPVSELLITVRNQRLYAIECDARVDKNYHEQVDFVRDHWKWLSAQ